VSWRQSRECIRHCIVSAKVVLLAAGGLNNKEIGERIHLPRQIVSKWRNRFFGERLAGWPAAASLTFFGGAVSVRRAPVRGFFHLGR
jgi:hypothetical protein